MESHELLNSFKIKATQNRILILNCLQDEVHFHSIADIARHIGSVNTKSIYNNIKVLIAAGLIDAYSFHGTSKYALSDAVIGKRDAAHLIDDHDLVSHIELPESLYTKISDAAKKSGREVKTIKIFIEVA